MIVVPRLVVALTAIDDPPTVLAVEKPVDPPALDNPPIPAEPPHCRIFATVGTVTTTESDQARNENESSKSLHVYSTLRKAR